MNKVIITIGCSGSGKTTFCQKKYPDYKNLCMDDIRKELTGNISDQSKNEEVFKTLCNRIVESVKDKSDICITNTNLGGPKGLKFIAERLSKNSEVTLLFFEDSLNWELCQKRVEADISNGVERSDTTGNRESGIPIIKEMSEKYIQMSKLSKEHKENFEKVFKRCKSCDIQYVIDISDARVCYL